ncbi:transcriptional regulatory protein [Tolypocladium capitatum]|uniref:Transcriptional regulatory protein n=1 Tax=Tolypocladium capitatum TaxID=45235 RepID=A0A2K3QPN1_9HYPO|nr:transcriptional regulatory protein [Tolypocladium capitatum]
MAASRALRHVDVSATCDSCAEGACHPSRPLACASADGKQSIEANEAVHGRGAAMEQIETQASDLRYLAQAPVALRDSASVSYDTPAQGCAPGSAAFGANSAPTASKRKSVDDELGSGQKQRRSKRNRRRKIKCNGETPCQRCGNLNLACLYAPNCCASNLKDTDEFKAVAAQLTRLQDDVSWLNQAVRSMQTNSSRLAPPNDRIMSSSTPQAKVGASLQGPTSLAFSLDVANTTIANMGYRGIDGPDDQDQQSNDVPMPMGNTLFDPLLEYDKDEIVRLCRFHEEEMGIMFPVLNINAVIAYAKNILPFLESARSQQRLAKVMEDVNTLELKMVMATALMVEEHGHSDRATRLYGTIEPIVNRMLMVDASDVTTLPLLFLVAGYRYLSNDEVLAWRIIGQVVRLCIEAGITRKKGLMKIQDESERKNALNAFWSAYVLERRWGFSTGLPFILQDEDIDPRLPFPDEYPFLVAMISYSRLAAKVWRQVSHFEPVLARDVRQEEIDSLDGEILQWYEGVPEEVKVHNWDKEKQMTSTPSYNLQRLRIWTYLRLNQIRIWLYTPILYSATSIMSHPQHAQRVVDLAKDTIRYLDHLNSTTNLYRKIQAFYNQFLISAIAVVFLASVHAPVRFSAVCREEFYMALDLVQDLSAKSWLSKRLWSTIKSLKDVAPRFGLNPDNDPHSTAALGMIGLARGHMDPSSVVQPPFPNLSMGTSQQQTPKLQVGHNGKKIQTELSRIFEGYVALNGFQYGNGDGQVPPDSELASADAGGHMFAPDVTVFHHLREMF